MFENYFNLNMYSTWTCYLIQTLVPSQHSLHLCDRSIIIQSHEPETRSHPCIFFITPLCSNPRLGPILLTIISRTHLFLSTPPLIWAAKLLFWTNISFCLTADAYLILLLVVAVAVVVRVSDFVGAVNVLY